MTVPASPPTKCTTWCENPEGGWEVTPFSTVHVCRRTLPAGRDADGDPVEVRIERHVSLEFDGPVDEPVTVQVVGGERLGPLGALSVAQALIAAVGVLASKTVQAA